jgi:hypothetical protein
MKRKIPIMILAIGSLVCPLFSSQILAQGIPATISPVFNAAIINGPASMIWEQGKASGSGLICGRTYSNDNEKAELLARQSQGLCGANRNPRINTPTFKNNLLKGTTKKVQGSATALKFTPSITIRRNNFARLVSQLIDRDPVTAKKLERLFASTDVVDELGKAMKSLGLQSNNVADAYTIYLTQVWMRFHDRVESLPQSQMMAVRNQAANALLATPQFASASDAQKQEIAEAMLIQTVLIAASINSAESNPTLRAQMKTSIAQGAKGMGLDLDRMTLTTQGFRSI